MFASSLPQRSIQFGGRYVVKVACCATTARSTALPNVNRRQDSTALFTTHVSKQEPPLPLTPTTRDIKRRNPLEHQIEERIKVPVGSLGVADVKFLTDSIYNLCKPKARGQIPQSTYSLAQRVFHRVLEEKPAIDIPQKLSSTLVRTAARNGDFRTAKSILDTLISLHTENPHLHSSPTDYHWSTVIFGCATDASSPAALPTAEEVLRGAEAAGVVTIQMYNNLLLLLSRRSATHYGAAATAEDVLLRLTAAAAERDDAVQPTPATYNLVLLAWGRAPEPQGASRAETVLQVLVEAGGQPDAVAFGTVITAYGQRGLAEDAQRILDQAVQVLGSDANNNNNSPHDLTGCWDAACIAWAQQGAVDAVRHLMETAPPNVKVSLTRHNAYLYALLQNDKVVEAEHHLLKVMPGFVAPTLKEFGLVLRYFCYKKSSREATRFLHEMFSLSSTRGFLCVPSEHDVSLVLKCWSERPISKQKARINMLGILDAAESRRIVNSDCYTVVIRTFCAQDMSVYALKVLKRLEAQVDNGSIKWMHPNFVVDLYSGVLSSLCRDRNSTELWMEFLPEIPRTGKRAVLTGPKEYAAVLLALQRASKSKRATASLNLFDELKERDEDPSSSMKLDAALCERVLCNLDGHDGHAFTALRILRTMMESFLMGRHELEPTTGCYNATFKCLLAVGALDEFLGIIRQIYNKQHRHLWKNQPSESVLNRLVHFYRRRGHHDIENEIRALIPLSAEG